MLWRDPGPWQGAPTERQAFANYARLSQEDNSVSAAWHGHESSVRRVVATLSTIPSRLPQVSVTVSSLLRQKPRPRRIYVFEQGARPGTCAPSWLTARPRVV